MAKKKGTEEETFAEEPEEVDELFDGLEAVDS